MAEARDKNTPLRAGRVDDIEEGKI